jgi:two-component system response regulator FixJ
MPHDADSLVYIVDDDDAIRTSLLILLDAYGLQARAFGTPAEFLETTVTSGPCCLVLDARLPGMSGLELLQHLVAEDALIPCIMITGHGDKDLFDEAARLGVRHCFKKPFDSAELIASIEAAIADCRRAG